MRCTEGRTCQCEGINVEQSAAGGASLRILSFVNPNLDLTLDRLKIVYSDRPRNVSQRRMQQFGSGKNYTTSYALHPSSRLNIQISPMKLAFP